MAEDYTWRLLVEHTNQLSLNVDDDNILQETGDAILLEGMETPVRAAQFYKYGFNCPSLVDYRHFKKYGEHL